MLLLLLHCQVLRHGLAPKNQAPGKMFSGPVRIFNIIGSSESGSDVTDTRGSARGSAGNIPPTPFHLFAHLPTPFVRYNPGTNEDGVFNHSAAGVFNPSAPGPSSNGIASAAAAAAAAAVESSARATFTDPGNAASISAAAAQDIEPLCKRIQGAISRARSGAAPVPVDQRKKRMHTSTGLPPDAVLRKHSFVVSQALQLLCLSPTDANRQFAYEKLQALPPISADGGSAAPPAEHQLPAFTAGIAGSMEDALFAATGYTASVFGATTPQDILSHCARGFRVLSIDRDPDFSPSLPANKNRGSIPAQVFFLF